MTHVVLSRREDINKIDTLDDLLSSRLFDLASHAMGCPMPGRNPRIETVETTPLALVMVSQGLGLAIGHFPVCVPLADALNLEVCPLVLGRRDRGITISNSR